MPLHVVCAVGFLVGTNPERAHGIRDMPWLPLRDGASVEDFLSWFPGVQRDQVEAVLDHELESLVGSTT